MKRNNTYVILAGSSFILAMVCFLTSALCLVFSLSRLPCIVVMCFSLPLTLTGAWFINKDIDVNKEYDKEENDRKKYEEIKRLTGKYDNHT